MTQPPAPPSPVNPIPPVVVALFVVIMGVEAVFALGAQGVLGSPAAIGWRNAAIQDYAFNGEILRWMLDNGTYPVEHLRRLVTYAFVHGAFTQALFAGVLLLALGKFVGEVFGGWPTLALFVISTVAGALAYTLAGASQPWLFGAFPGVYGLIGGFTYLIWLRLGQVGAPQLRAFGLIGILLGIQLLFALLFGGNATWLADLGGFGGGFAASFLLAPGGWARLRDKLRQR